MELRLDIELHLDWNTLVEQANHAVVVLDRKRDARNAFARVLVA